MQIIEMVYIGLFAIIALWWYVTEKEVGGSGVRLNALGLFKLYRGPPRVFWVPSDPMNPLAERTSLSHAARCHLAM